MVRPHIFALLIVLILTGKSGAKRTSDEDTQGGSGSGGDGCSPFALNEYMQCMRENSCVCANCDPNPTDNFPIIEVDAPQSCQDVSHIFCPLIRCCSPCEHVFEVYHKCLASIITETFLGVDHDCPFFSCPLAAFPYQDEMERCANDSPCHDVIEDYGECVASQSGKRCQACAAKTDWRKKLLSRGFDSDGGGAGGVTQSNDETWTCGQLSKAIICPMQDCCPECSIRLERVVKCLQHYDMLVEPHCLDHGCSSGSSS
jgi:hypothetical protein